MAGSSRLTVYVFTPASARPATARTVKNILFISVLLFF
jgi:hypothetical protein